MALTFSYTDVSSENSLITKKLVVSPTAQTAPSGFSSFQFTMAFDTAAVTLQSFSVVPTNSQALFVTNPTTVADINASGLVRASAVALSGLAAQSPLVELQYTFAEGTDPGLTFSAVLIDDKNVLTGSEVTTTIAGSTLVDVETVTVSSLVGSSASRYVVTLDTGQIALASTSRSVGDVVPLTDLVILKTTASVDTPAAALSTASLVSTEIADASAGIQFVLTYNTGAVSTLTYNTTTGVLATATEVPAEGSSDSGESEGSDGSDSGSGSGDGGVSNGGIVEDGVNTGSGVIDATGLEVVADEVNSVFTAAAAADVVYRQRLNDAVAFEAINRDGSMSGKIIGDGDARTVSSVDCGSIKMSIDGPSGFTVDLAGLAAPASGDRISSYLNTLIDSVLPASNPTFTTWSNSLKSAVLKTTANQGATSADLKLIIPVRAGSQADEVSFGSLSDTDATGVISLPASGDVISMAAFENIIAVGPGTVVASNASGANVYGDVNAQDIRGGVGADILSGGGGNDVLTGGSGADTFELGSAGRVTITDLQANDQLKFELFGVSNSEQLAAQITRYAETSDGLEFEFGDFTVVLQGYSTLADLSSAIVFG